MTDGSSRHKYCMLQNVLLLCWYRDLRHLLSSFQEFAETAMNELLGLYGYGKVDSRDTLGLSLHRFTNHSPPHAAGSSPLRPANHSPSRQARQSPPLSTNHSPQQHASDHEHEGDSLDSDDMPVPGQLEHSVRSVSPGKTDQGSGSSRGSTPKSGMSSSGCSSFVFSGHDYTAAAGD